MHIPITVTETTNQTRRGAPVELGLPLPEGAAAADTHWVVLDEQGKALPSQFKPLAQYADGSLRAAHGVLLLDMEPGQTRHLTVAAGEAPVGEAPVGEAPAGDAILRAEGEQFRVKTGGMDALFSAQGELVSLRYRGEELLDAAAGNSLALQLTLGPAGGNLERAPRPPQIVATIKESGPARAMLNLRGKVWLADRRGEIELALDADYVFYAGRAEIHLRPMLLGAVTEATVLSEWSLIWRLRSGKRMRYGRSAVLAREDPDHENMSWRGLQQGWVNWRLAGGATLTAWSPDFQRHQNGFVHTRVQDEARERIRVAWARIEPQWGYQDVSNPPKPVTINRGGWRRWETTFALHDEATDPAALSEGWESPLRAFPAPEHYRQALRPWLEGITQRTPLREVVATKCQEFVCKEPEYYGSLHGGWDGPNQTYIERGVSRADFGEYLYNEFFRSAEPRFYRMAFDFGQVYRDIYCFTIPEASAGPRELGGARSRQSEHNVDPIRSYRGAVLLADMYQETGDERYLEALRLRADFHLANYPHRVGRVSMSTRDSAYMARYLGRPELIAKAVEVTLHSLDKHFDPQHGYFEGYDESRTLPDGRFPAHPIPGGLWFMRDWLYTSNASPEMTSYNIIGWYGMRLLHDPGAEIMDKIRRVCEWMRDCQNADGSWPYPHDTSATRWGHGSLQDAQAMVFAFKMFGDRSFLESAARSIAFSERMFAQYGRIPLLLGLLPHEETEDSLTYYYGIETLAHYAEIIRGG